MSESESGRDSGADGIPSSDRHYEPIAMSSESTVVAEYVPDTKRETAYQSEAELEKAFIALLQEQAYEYLPITSEDDLVANLRTQLSTLNGIEFSDREWEAFFTGCLARDRDGIVEKTTRLQDNHIQILKRDDGTKKNIRLIDKEHVHNNRLQVINQYEATGKRATRYDVTVLVNGLPMVHIELKRRGVPIREAFNQINRYQRDSFWAGSGLFEYVQVFVISNGTHTKYYSNTTRREHVEEAIGAARGRATNTSFEFTSWWADATNKPIQDLTGFTKTFFSKHALLSILTRYCVFTSDRDLLVMRPYQIVATETILNRVVVSSNHGRLGTTDAGGYVWHTTGSGKTLTSFKTAQLVSRLPGVDKVLFVVDRKDLDYQTMKEYDRFQKGAANSNTSTAILARQLDDPDARIIVTTIQKLSLFVERNKRHALYGRHVVLIFDECHRSQFGEMHSQIAKAFRSYHLFGFTGTPIFAVNAPSGGNPQLCTTEQAFGEKLHTYTIVDAIRDGNVLPFRIEYLDTIGMRPDVRDKPVRAIDTEKALLAPERIAEVVTYIREHFDQKTKRNSTYRLKERRVSGFNSILATSSIQAAILYYNQFAKQQFGIPEDQRLKVAMIYSFAANEDEGDGLLPDEQFEVSGLDQSSRDHLDDAILDYNDMFGTSFDTSADGFQNYHRDVSQRVRDRDLDLLIVVNMFLTGFDAVTLNTLWVDKNLRLHGLVQAFSRTNRILNSVKTFGNIVSFRNLEDETNEAIALFGDKDAHGIVVLKPYAEYYEEYQARVAELLERFPLGETIVGESAQKAFIALFGAILKLRNILQSFDDFLGNGILSERDVQDYQSVYLDLYQEFRRRTDAEKESIVEDVIFEIELIKQVEINVDYILGLVKTCQGHMGRDADKELEVKATIERAVDSSIGLRSKKDLIRQFVDALTVDAEVDGDWRTFVAERRSGELEQIIAEESLNREATLEFVENAFRDGVVSGSGMAITRILPPVSRFSKTGEWAAKKQRVIDRLTAFVERFLGLG